MTTTSAQRREAERLRDLAANIQDDYNFDKGAAATALRAYANTLHPATTLADIKVDYLMGQLWKAVDVAIPTGFGEWKRTPACIVNVETGTGHVSVTDGTGGYWRLPRSAHGRITLRPDRNDNVVQEGK